MAHAGHPLIGDELYGVQVGAGVAGVKLDLVGSQSPGCISQPLPLVNLPPAHPPPLLQGAWIGRQALHAAGMGLQHPVGGHRMRFLAPVPPDFAAALHALGLGMEPGELQRAVEAAWEGLEGGG